MTTSKDFALHAAKASSLKHNNILCHPVSSRSPPGLPSPLPCRAPSWSYPAAARLSWHTKTWTQSKRCGLRDTPLRVGISTRFKGHHRMGETELVGPWPENLRNAWPSCPVFRAGNQLVLAFKQLESNAAKVLHFVNFQRCDAGRAVDFLAPAGDKMLLPVHQADLSIADFILPHLKCLRTPSTPWPCQCREVLKVGPVLSKVLWP